MTKAIQIVETRKGMAICETTPRYDVVFFGERVFQCYFNTRGYVGYLPTPRGLQLNCGEVSISRIKKLAAERNKEWATTTNKFYRLTFKNRGEEGNTVISLVHESAKSPADLVKIAVYIGKVAENDAELFLTSEELTPLEYWKAFHPYRPY